MNADGSNPQNLTHSSAYDYWPCWSRIRVPAGIKDGFGELPKDFKLYQNYPNLFNAEATVSFELKIPVRITSKS